MNQINFSEDLKKTKSRLKRAQVMPKVKFTQPLQKKQNYLTIHNKIKVQYRNREYKNVFQKLIKLDKPQVTYLPLYFQDLSCSINKMLREYIIHKDVNSSSSIQAYIHQGKDTIQKLYRLFISHEQIITHKKYINTEMQNNISRFLNIIISFTLQYAIICIFQNKRTQAKLIYQQLYCICSNILTSSTSVGEGLLVYAVYLIDNMEIERGIEILFECLKSEMNILIILSYRIRQKSKKQDKRRKMQLFNRLYAIFYNLAYCYQLTSRLHWVYLCLKQCELLTQLKINLLQKDIKINWQQILKGYQILYDEYRQLKTIVQIYFKYDELKQQLKIFKKYDNNPIYFRQDTHKDLISIKSFQKNNKNQNQKKRRIIRRSVSLQQHIQCQNNKHYYKDFGKQLLFYGLDLFNKPIIKQKKAQTVILKQKSNAIIPQGDALQKKQELTSKFSKKQISRLKKKGRNIKNNLFRKIQKHIEYDQLQKKFEKMWIQQQQVNNRCKQRRTLLRYKSQYINYKQIAQQNINIYQQIQVNTNKNDNIFKQKKKLNDIQQQQKQKGIDLFKKIILKYCKKIDIKKSQTLNILKKKRINLKDLQSYSPPQISVNFLLDKVKRQKQKAEDSLNKIKQQQQQKLQRQKYKGNHQNIFLTKDTVEIPNLFLSYIASSGFSCQSPASILEYSYNKTNKPI